MTESLPKATHRGILKIGDIHIPVAVLDNGKRVISETGLTRAMLGTRSGASRKIKYASVEAGTPIPLFLASSNLKPFVSQDLLEGPLVPVEYQDRKRIVKGYEATLLPIICDIWLKAREKGLLKPRQLDKALKAEILMRGLAHVGVIALVDEATGYQYDRERDALYKILEAYIAKELLPWTKRFPNEFYKELFRLRGWQYNPISIKRPILVGKLTNQLVYKQLPPGVLDELKQKNPKDEKGHRKHRHHQFLTEDIGNPHLERHIASVTTLMRAAPNWSIFKRLFARAFHAEPYQEEIVFNDDPFPKK
jgi:hypothetical protein